MRRKVNLILLALIVVIGGPWYWLLIDNRPGNAQAKPITLTELRQLASAIPGTPPKSVEVELVAHRLLPRDLFAAGSGLKRTVIGVMAWRLPVEGGKPIMIDSGITAADAADMGITNHDGPAQQRVEGALRQAGLVLFTHEHPDHQAAAIRLGGEVLQDVAMFNPGQLPPTVPARNLPWTGQTAPLPRIIGSAPVAVAPGVVVIPAPSHTLGSQLIFVRLADGREVLFVGDIGTLAANWRELRARSRLIGDYLAPENRDEVYAWLNTIRAWQREEPRLVILPGHDSNWLRDDPATRTAIRFRFSQ